RLPEGIRWDDPGAPAEKREPARWPNRRRRCKAYRARGALREGWKVLARTRRERASRGKRQRQPAKKRDGNVCESFHPLEPAGQPGRGNVHHETFERKRYESQIAGDGHFENFPVLKHRKRVVPFRLGPVVPEFPKPAANPTRGEEAV